MMHVVVTAEPFAPAHEVARFAAARGDQCGALASFVGYCRGHAGESSVTALELEHYPGFTESEIKRLAQQVSAKNALDALLVIRTMWWIAQADETITDAESRLLRTTMKAVTELHDDGQALDAFEKMINVDVAALLREISTNSTAEATPAGSPAPSFLAAAWSGRTSPIGR